LRCTSAHATIAVPSIRGGALPTAASQQTRLMRCSESIVRTTGYCRADGIEPTS
jgi:hypothetical protein